MEKPGSTRNVGGIEENILAILGSSEAKDNQDAYEDRITFLEAVRAASIIFQLLIQELVDATGEANFQASETKSLAKMLLFQYLINVLEWDFLPRNCIYKETMNWVVLRESLLNMLLNSVSQPAESFDTAAAIALLEIGKNTCIAMQKFLVIIMELDVSKQSADTQGSTTRADSIRTPLLEMILEELTYNKEILDPFLQPSIRTRRSNGPPDDDASFNGALKCFSNITSAKSTIKKIRTEVVQLLLAHGFQAHLSLPCENCLVGDASASDEETRSGSLVEICENIMSAFKNMKAADKSRHSERKHYLRQLRQYQQSHNMLQVSCK